MPKILLALIVLFFLTVSTSFAQSTQAETGRKVDEFYIFNCEDLMARLDFYAVELQNAPDKLAYIIVFGGQHERRGEPDMWASRIKHYLTTNRQIEAGRIVTTIGGYRERREVELWILPNGTPGPFARATIKTKDVKFKGGRIKAADYRRCGEMF